MAAAADLLAAGLVLFAWILWLGALGIRYTYDFAPKVDPVTWDANRALAFYLGVGFCGLAVASSGMARIPPGSELGFVAPLYFVALASLFTALGLGSGPLIGRSLVKRFPLLRNQSFCRVCLAVSGFAWLLGLWSIAAWMALG